MPRLFEVKFITKDARLGASLVALEGIALGRPEVTPIRGAEIKGNKVHAVRSDSVRDTIAKFIARHKGREITRAEIARMIEQHGGVPGSAGSLIVAFKKRGLLKGKGIGHKGFKVL